MKKLLISIFFFLSLCLSIIIVSAEPIVENVIIEPTEPKVMDTITITATINSDEEIDEVIIRIKECDETLCMQTKSYEMDLEDGKYIITDELTYASATYFSYQFIITSNGNETETQLVNVTLKPVENGGTNGEDGESDNGIPIFVFIILIIVIIVAVTFIVLRKK